MSTKDPSSPVKPSPTANVKPSRLPAPALFVGPPSRNASQLSVSHQGLDPTKPRDPLNRQRSALVRSGNTKDGTDAKDKDHAMPTLKKASEREADAKWREMQSTLNEVELTAQSSTHVFGESHAAALEELRKAQIELARAWGRGNEDKGSPTNPQADRFSEAESIARDRQTGVGGRNRGNTDASASTVLSDESVLSSGTARSPLEDETAQDIKLASERRAANEAYFKKVEGGVKEVVKKLEVVAEAMRGVEGESRSLWSQSSGSRSEDLGEGMDSAGGREGKAQTTNG
ncbi:hypothetical protein LTR78_005261 [Recurvomyces mirabilis]|uniref:Uncharacterized protein n=1 Tax=Recurvomyces mirabilis TaxID=574656 RepID=A0AAE0WND1_9PEZI|nr:hypothetical protein LTR78_005261 [Recurvomyces mirabilis]KAK5157811.1 hypothetical protein LTS14_003733 [Recurvomyces mirabilis]